MAGRKRKSVADEKRWFSAKGLFRHTHKGDCRHAKDRYEESIVILKASSEEQAAERARKLFKEREYEDQECSVTFTWEYEICELLDPVREGREVYWFMRISNLSPQKYVAKYWDDDGRPESCDQKGWTHFWHNLDGKSSACINCREVRKGQLWKQKKSSSRARQQKK